MVEPLKISALCALSVLGVLASVSGVPLYAALAVGCVAGALAWWQLRTVERSADKGMWDVLLLLAFFPLLFAFVTTPGADAAMYAAQARALLQGSSDLSAAYPGVEIALYPRGFPALIALFEPLIGMPKASLAAAAIGYVVFVIGLSWWLRKVLPDRFALAMALFLTLLSRFVPLGFFSWGGNPSVFGFGMALLAISLAADAERRSVLACAAVILAGAYAIHPIGAFGATACAPLLFFLPRFDLVRVGRVAIIGIAIAPLLWCFKHFGPVISDFENAWIVRWQDGPAHLIGHKVGIFLFDYLSAFSLAVSDTFAVVFYICLAVALFWWREHRRLALFAIAGLTYVAFLMTFGPKLPAIGTFIYADRLTLMWLACVAPVMAVVAEHATRVRAFDVRGLKLGVCLVLLAITHQRWHLGSPLLTEDDIAIAPCVAEKVRANETIVASYGQGGQWLPALTGRVITHMHSHCTLFDEISAIRAPMRSHFQYLSTHGTQYAEELPALPASETLCEHGGVKLVRLTEDALPGPDPF